MFKTYYRIEFELTSPLIVGDGTGTVADMDVARGSDGRPYIPGSAIAGVLRHSLSDSGAEARLFGYIKDDDINESKVITYDATLIGNATISIRDCVKLDENKVAQDGAKFDFEVVETGARFVTYLEHDESVELSDMEALIGYMNSPLCTFGSKTSRGYGSFVIASLKQKSFDLINDVYSWLDFDIFSDECWADICETNPAGVIDNDSLYITLSLEQTGGISIRRYSTRVGKSGSDSNGPDSVQLYVKNGNTEIPVIPGTSWAGAFRSRMNRFHKLKTAAPVDVLYGTVNEKNHRKEKSNIVFSETMLKDAVPVINTRTAIDRFTGGSLKSALFKEKTYYYGKGELNIVVRGANDKSTINGFEESLAAAISDLHLGLLAIGGLTSVGRGQFKVNGITVNGREYDIPQNDLEVYDTVLNAIKEGGKC